jgi:hypothetical protein
LIEVGMNKLKIALGLVVLIVLIVSVVWWPGTVA